MQCLRRKREHEGSTELFENLVVRREFGLAVADEGVADRSVDVDQKQRRTRDVPCIEADAVPHAVRAEHVPARVDQNVERQTRLLDVATDGLRILRDDGDNLDAACGVVGNVSTQLAEPAAAVRSPRAAVEREQQPSAGEEVGKRTNASLLIRKTEIWRPRQRRSVHQNNLTSTSSPASTMSTWAGIST